MKEPYTLPFCGCVFSIYTTTLVKHLNNTKKFEKYTVKDSIWQLLDHQVTLTLWFRWIAANFMGLIAQMDKLISAGNVATVWITII